MPTVKHRTFIIHEELPLTLQRYASSTGCASTRGLVRAVYAVCQWHVVRWFPASTSPCAVPIASLTVLQNSDLLLLHLNPVRTSMAQIGELVHQPLFAMWSAS